MRTIQVLNMKKAAFVHILLHVVYSSWNAKNSQFRSGVHNMPPTTKCWPMNNSLCKILTTQVPMCFSGNPATLHSVSATRAVTTISHPTFFPGDKALYNPMKLPVQTPCWRRRALCIQSPASTHALILRTTVRTMAHHQWQWSQHDSSPCPMTHLLLTSSDKCVLMIKYHCW